MTTDMIIVCIYSFITNHIEWLIGGLISIISSIMIWRIFRNREIIKDHLKIIPDDFNGFKNSQTGPPYNMDKICELLENYKAVKHMTVYGFFIMRPKWKKIELICDRLSTTRHINPIHGEREGFFEFDDWEWNKTKIQADFYNTYKNDIDLLVKLYTNFYNAVYRPFGL